jgi:hypothetical protein
MTNGDKEYWVEARPALCGSGKIISYGVWHINAKSARTCVKRFSVSRNGGAQVAWYLANAMRDDLNGERK